MATRRPYPLAALEQHRRRLVAEARAALAHAIFEATRARNAAEEARLAHAAAVELLRVEQERSGDGTAADAGARSRWLAAQRRTEEELGAETGRLLAESRRAAAMEDRRRESLTEAERELRAVERHRERFEAALRAARLAAEEAEQEDQVAARAQRPR